MQLLQTLTSMDIATEHHVHKNQGNFNFSTTFTPDIGIVSSVADLDGDGRPDFVKVNNYFDSMIYISQNKTIAADIAFAAPFITQVPGIYRGPGTADLDGDGRPEIVYVNYTSDSIIIFINQTGAGAICPGGSTSFRSGINAGSAFQWQVNTGTGFTNIAPGANYSGINTAILQLNNIPSAWYGYQYRCIAGAVNSAISTLQFFNNWTGAVSSAWQDPANWSCGVVPDSNTDVVITSGTIVIGSNTTIRSLKITPGVNFTIAPGVVFTILH
jgi:FG-GAP-like repeat